MKRMNRSLKLSAAALALGLMATGAIAAEKMKPPKNTGITRSDRFSNGKGKNRAAEKWMTGDFHQHTTFTDGSYPMNDLTAEGVIAKHAYPKADGLFKKGVMPQGFRFGLDFQANSEHGGLRERDGFGIYWDNGSVYPVVPAIGDPTSGKMWRWQSLISFMDVPDYRNRPAYLGAYDWIEGIRANYPNKIAMTGMEWNPPGHEHSSTGILGADAKPIAEFEYRFDKSDTDGTSTTATATAMGWTGKRQNNSYTAPDYSAELGLNAQHEKTLDAVRWMQENYPNNGWIIPAHVERAGCGVSAWSIAAFRDMNDAGPSVAFGFEGIPGHEKSSNRGEFGSNACGGGTYGGAGVYVAKVGGLWDNLLADGRRFFNFANSDFHSDGGADFWPGEYLKTYVKVKDEDGDGSYSQEEILDGLRSGNAFSVHGDIIDALDFKAFYGASFRNRGRHNYATMGESLKIEKGDKVTIQIRFKTPEANNCKAGINASATYVCQAPTVHHVQLIQGKMRSSRASKLLADHATPNPEFNAIDETAADVAATFDAESWTLDREGYTTMRFEVSHIQQGMFFRIRGTNLGYGVAKKDAADKMIYGTDDAGNPLINTPGTNTVDMAWDDLWFYSNPIFVEVME